MINTNKEIWKWGLFSFFSLSHIFPRHWQLTRDRPDNDIRIFFDDSFFKDPSLASSRFLLNLGDNLVLKVFYIFSDFMSFMKIIKGKTKRLR